MNIHCICIAKDEADFIGEVLISASKWADNIFFADNGSSDNTQTIVEQLSLKYGNIINLGMLNDPFSDTLIAKVFNMVKSCSKPGDWWCRLDADEVYIDDPHQFLRFVPSIVDTVWSEHYDFWFTEEDYYLFQQSEIYRSTAVVDRLKYFCKGGSERRFVKHTLPFVWTGPWPKFRLLDSKRKIRLAQYQYRSPDQILLRISNRKTINASMNGGIFDHELKRDDLRKTLHPPYASNEIVEVPRVMQTSGLVYFDGEWPLPSDSDVTDVTRLPRPVLALLFISRVILGRLRLLFSKISGQ